MSAKPSTSARRHLRTKQAILDAALALVIEKGPDQFSLREVARRVDYSPAGLYEYFRDKEAIIAALCQTGFKRLAVTLNTVASDLPQREYLAKLGLAYLGFAQKNPEYYRLIFNFIPSKRQSLQEPVEDADPYNILLKAMAKGLESGVIKASAQDQAETLSYNFWALLHGIAMLRSTVLKDFDADFATADRRAIEIFLKGLS